MATAENPHLTLPVRRAGAATDAAALAAILLHGRGQGAEFMLDVQRRIGREEQVTFLVPDAFEGTWYPNRFTDAAERIEPWLGWALEAVDAAVATARDEGFEPARTVMVGFSQGGCLLAEHLARFPAAYGGVALLTGALIGPLDATREPRGRLDGVPIFLGTARNDDWVPLKHVRATADALARAGAATSLEVYEDVEHQVNDDEIARVRGLIDDLLPNAGRPRG